MQLEPDEQGEEHRSGGKSRDLNRTQSLPRSRVLPDAAYCYLITTFRALPSSLTRGAVGVPAPVHGDRTARTTIYLLGFNAPRNYVEAPKAGRSEISQGLDDLKVQGQGSCSGGAGRRHGDRAAKVGGRAGLPPTVGSLS